MAYLSKDLFILKINFVHIWSLRTGLGKKKKNGEEKGSDFFSH